MTGRSEPTPPNSGPSASAPCDSTIQPCIDKHLKGEVIEVKWESGLKISYAKSTVSAPHWQVGTNVDDGPGSKKPAVYLINGKGSNTLTVKVKITENLNVTGTGKLTTQLGSLKIEGTCPTAVGEHTVAATITNLPDYIAHEQGTVSWHLESPDLGKPLVLLNMTRLEVFVVLDTPQPYYKPGVWTEALRFVCDTVNVAGLKVGSRVAETITKYCHGSHGLSYDTVSGAPAYGVNGRGGAFELGDYIKAARKIVNCYDQAAAIQSLSGAVGVKLDWLFLQPFGYINTSNLIGVGMCNNPFFMSNGTTPIVARTDPNRTGFGNHAFGELTGKVLDACAGPHVGTEDRTQYCTASIDPIMPGSGTAANIVVHSGVTDVS